MRVCCRIISDSQMAYGSRVSRHGKERPFSWNQSMIVVVKLIAYAGVGLWFAEYGAYPVLEILTVLIAHDTLVDDAEGQLVGVECRTVACQ